MEALPMTQRFFLIIALATAAFLFNGCNSKPATLPLHPATGELRIAGRPVAGVAVTLHPTPELASRVGALRPHGQTDGQGRFTLTTYAARDGVPEGEWFVTLVWPDDRLPPAQREQILAQGDSLPDRFQGRYAGPSAELPRVTVLPQENNLPPIQIPF
jgi:hypothetical protein